MSSQTKRMNEYREVIAAGTKVAFVNANGKLRIGIAEETIEEADFYTNETVRRVRVNVGKEGTVSPHIERVAVLDDAQAKLFGM